MKDYMAIDQDSVLRSNQSNIDITQSANEVCVAIETLKIAFPEIFKSHVGKALLQRKAELNASLSRLI